MSRPHQRPPAQGTGNVGDLLGAVVFGTLAALAVGHWLIGNLAALLSHGHPLRGSTLIQGLTALSQLPHHGGDPRRSWPPSAAAQLPGPVLYWTSTVLVLAALALLGMLALRLFSAGSVGSSDAGRRRREPIDKR